MKTQLVLLGVFFATISATAIPATAQVLFEDDFEDGNAQDGVPVNWVTRTLTGADYGVISGDFVFQAGPDFVPGGDALAADPVDFVLEDSSEVAQVRGVAPFANMGIGARWNEAQSTGYWNAIFGDGSFYIGRSDGSGYVILASGNVPFDVTSRDVLLRFDAIGTTLKTWAWLPGEPMPEQPLLTAEDATYQSGTPAIFANASPGGAAIYRFVNVSVPEPSTMAMSTFGALCVLARKRRRRASSPI